MIGLATQATGLPEEELLEELELDDELELLLELLEEAPGGGVPGSPPHALKSIVAVHSIAVPRLNLAVLQIGEGTSFDILIRLIIGDWIFDGTVYCLLLFAL